MDELLSLWRRFVGQHPVIVNFCGPDDPWLQQLTSRFPDSQVHSLPAQEASSPLPQARRIHLVRASSLASLEALRDQFFRQRIQSVAFPAQSEIAAFLRFHQFDLLTANAAAPRVLAPDIPLPAGSILLAVHRRLTSPFAQGPAGPVPLDLPAIFQNLGIAKRGVIHIGAGNGQFVDLYRAMGFQKMLFIEANPAVYQRLSQRVAAKNDTLAVLCAISNRNGLETLRVMNDDRKSSILALKKHAELYPDIKETSQILAPARRLDHLLSEIGQNPADYNFLHLDIQGAELKALQGAIETLPHIDAISTEVNYEELYEGCPLVEDLDDFLDTWKFKRYYTATPAHPEWGDAFYLRNPRVSMRTLGRWGRFGNQVFEYAFVKIFGRTHDLEVQTSPWIGQQLFGASDAIVREELRQYQEVTYALADSQVARLNTRQANLDLRGVFQYHTSYYAPHKEYFRSLFQPVPALQKILDVGIAKIHAQGKNLVALHLRRGDYGYGMFFIPPTTWYLDWLKALWPTLDNPVLYIATDEPAKVAADFAQYKPLFAADLNLPGIGADYYPDFYVLSQAHAAAISNSTYSFAACMLNAKSNTFLRPDLYAGKLVSFDPWNDEPLLHRELGLIQEKEVRHVLDLQKQAPKDERVIMQLRQWRADLADSWAQITADKLPLVITRDLWSTTALIRQAALEKLPLLPAEHQVLQRIRNRLAAAQGADAIGPYIAASLFAPRSTLTQVDLSALPESHRNALLAIP